MGWASLPRSPHRFIAFCSGTNTNGTDGLWNAREGGHSLHRGCQHGRRAGLDGTGVDSHRNTCVCVQGNDRGCSRSESWVGDKKSKLSVGGWHQLKSSKDFGWDRIWWTEFGAHWGAVDGQCWRKLHVKRLSQMRLLRWGRLRVVHGHHLSQTTGQVVEKSRPNLRIYSLESREKASHLVHALVESRAILAEHVCVSWQGCCKAKMSFIILCIWEIK